VLGLGELMKIQSFDKEIRDILSSNHYFRIPRFQRPYSWDEENIEEFWQDTIQDNEHKDYFIGSMVVYPDNGGVYGIVDGQQRLTTVIMMLCALRNYFAKEKLKDLSSGLHKLIEKPDIDDKLHFTLQTETSYPYLQDHILKSTPPDSTPKVNSEVAALKKAFENVEGKVSGVIASIKSDPSINAESREAAIKKKLTDIRDRVLSLKIIFIELENEEDAYLIFETLNTRGKDLKLSDLVKNHLTKQLKQKNKDLDYPKAQWGQIIEIIENSDVGLKMDTFLHHFWLSQYQYVPAKKVFKHLRKEVTVKSAKSFLSTLERKAKVYREIMDPSYRKWGKNDADIESSINALNLFRVVQPLPFIMSIMDEYKNGRIKKAQAKDMLETLENFHFVFTAVNSRGSSGGVTMMYAKHARDLLSSDKAKVFKSIKAKLKSQVPTYPEFQAKFAEIKFTSTNTKQKKLVRYILEKVHSHFKSANAEPTNYGEMTIEHIASEKPSAANGVSEDTIGKIGNMIFISQTLNNEKLKNKAFPEKIKILKENNCVIDASIEKAKKWTDTEIDARTKAVAKVSFDKIWKI